MISKQEINDILTTPLKQLLSIVGVRAYLTKLYISFQIEDKQDIGWWFETPHVSTLKILNTTLVIYPQEKSCS